MGERINKAIAKVEEKKRKRAARRAQVRLFVLFRLYMIIRQLLMFIRVCTVCVQKSKYYEITGSIFHASVWMKKCSWSDFLRHASL